MKTTVDTPVSASRVRSPEPEPTPTRPCGATARAQVAPAEHAIAWLTERVHGHRPAQQLVEPGYRDLVDAAGRSPSALDRVEARPPIQRQPVTTGHGDLFDAAGEIPGVQRQSRSTELGTGEIRLTALKGLAGSGMELPHLDRIQQAFGPDHDLSSVSAQVGGTAAETAERIRADAYTSGDRVAFRQAPDLRLSAHEAAHVVQQRAGVELAGGVGRAGDAYEENADQVAQRVVEGRSVQDLLPAAAGRAPASDVQRAHDVGPAAMEEENEEVALAADGSGETGDRRPDTKTTPPEKVDTIAPVQMHARPGAVVQRQPKPAPKASATDPAAYFPVVVPIPRDVSRDELLILHVQQALNVNRDTATWLIKEDGYGWTTYRPLNKAEIQSKRVRTRMSLRSYRHMRDLLGGAAAGRDPGGRPKGAGARDELYKKLPKPEKDKIDRVAGKGVDTRVGGGANKQPPKGGEKAGQEALRDELRDEILQKREKIEALPAEVKQLLVGEGTPRALDPVDYDKLLRIAEKLKRLSAQDLALYQLLARQLVTDLDVFERSIDKFIEVRDRYRAQLEQLAGSEPSLQSKIEAVWKDVDEGALMTMSPVEREALARRKAAEVRNIQLEHMITHPGETASGMVKGLDPREMAKAVAEDVAETGDATKGGFARWAAGFSGGAKISGWLAGTLGAIAAVAFVASLFIPGVNVAALITAALVTGVTSIALSAVSAELRIQAAVKAKNPDEFKRNTEKSGTEETNIVVAIVLMALMAVGAKLLARIGLPARMTRVRAAIQRARVRLLERIKLGGDAIQIRDATVAELNQQRAAIPEGLKKATASVDAAVKYVEGLTPEQLMQKLAAGDPVLNEVFDASTDLKSTAARIQQIAGTPEGKAAASQVREGLLGALRDGKAQTVTQVERFQQDVERAVADLRGAKTPEELQAALDKSAELFSQERLVEKAAADQTKLVKERALEQRYKAMSDEELAVDEGPLAKEEIGRRQAVKAAAEAEAKVWVDELRGRLSERARAKLDQIAAGKSNVETRALLERKGGREFLEKEAAQQRAAAEAHEASPAKAAAALHELENSGFFDQPEIKKLLVADDAAQLTDNAKDLQGKIAAEIAARKTAGKFSGQQDIKILRDVKVWKEEPGFTSVEDFLKAKHPYQGGRPRLNPTTKMVETLSTDIDVLVLRERTGKPAAIEMLEEVKSGEQTPGEAASQLNKAVLRLTELSQGKAKVRLEMNGKEITAQIDPATVGGAKLQKTGPLSGKSWDASLEITPADLFKIAKGKITLKGSARRTQ